MSRGVLDPTVLIFVQNSSVFPRASTEDCTLRVRDCLNLYSVRDHSLFMTGGPGWQKKGVGHEVFLTEKGGPPKNIGSKGGSSYLL